MKKTNEELSILKQECEKLDSKLRELSEDELDLVTGGASRVTGFATVPPGALIIHLLPYITGAETSNVIIPASGDTKPALASAGQPGEEEPRIYIR
ncbi:MAG: hypothetical protein KBT35_08550 [Firmicutes bacterium]|nr:hypothetical protein [Candidatus Colivicinus equi]